MAGGEQFLDLGPNAWNRGTICHEMGHVLGLWHEMQRTDRDTFVVINFSNIPTGAQANFAIIPGSTNHNAYDFFSVMHYDRRTFAINPNLDTISMQPAYAQFADIIGRVTYRTLSKLDRKGMAEVYGDPTPLPSAVVVNTKEGGRGSLRNALYYAFDRSTDMPPVATPVVFNIPLADPGFAGGVFTIKPTSLMVAPGAGTTIDGATQTTFTGNTNVNGPEIVLDGSQIAAQNIGLFAEGLQLREANCAVRNLVINGFNLQGISIQGMAATGNVVTGCYIGTNNAGTAAAPNGLGGIEIFGGAHSNTIGGTNAAARNVISGNTFSGIRLFDAGTTGNVVIGNYLGTNPAGTGAVANGFAGVEIDGGAHGNVVGATSASGRNLISGNKGYGVFIGETGSDGNVVLGNYIGVDVAGAAALANGFFNPATHFYTPGVGVFSGAQGTIIGGTAAGAGNLISGNAGGGIAIADPATSGTLVQGNFVGTNASGTAGIPSGAPEAGYNFDGIAIFNGAHDNTIGGSGSAARNVVSGNANSGLSISGANTANNFVRGNFIGSDASGAVAIANTQLGVAIFGGAHDNTIGGSAPGVGNVISGNGGAGVGFFDAATSANVVQGNLIGLNAAGLGALGNGYSGVDFFLAGNNTIGGTSGGARNFIAGNSAYGISVGGGNGNVIQGNTIGRNPAGAAVPNGFAGVALFNGAQSNTIGGSAAGASNLIASNTFEGVAMFDAATAKNAISRNSIFANSARGIGLFSGSNNAQPFPALSSAVLSTGSNPNGTDVAGTITAAASTTFTLEFFASPIADPSGFGEGQYFVGSAPVTTNGSGNASFAAPLAAAIPAGYVVSATATDPLGNTSEFSAVRTVTSTDNGADGLPDAWMLANFGHIDPRANDLSRANDDADGDGLTNLQEFMAGTDPRSATSGLRVLAVTKNGSDLSLAFRSVPGRTYRIEARDNFLLGPWLLFEDQVVATGTTTAVTDFGATLGPRRGYRVSVQP